TPGAPSGRKESASKAQPAVGQQSPKAETRKSHVDRLGDPLPDETVARMGSGRMRHPGYVRTLAFSPDGKSIVSGAGGGIRIWDAATGKLRRRFDVDTDWCLSFAIKSDNILVANAGFDKGTVTVQTVDPVSGKIRRRIEMKERSTTANLTFSPSGTRLA